MPSYLRMGLACSLGLALQLCLPLVIATSGVLQWLPAPLTAVITPFYANLLLSSTLTGLIVGRCLPGQYVQATLLILGATTLVTATSRPGFFRKMGFDYTEQQKRTNALKEERDPGLVARDENNKGEQGGGGYGMFKPL